VLDGMTMVSLPGELLAVEVASCCAFSAGRAAKRAGEELEERGDEHERVVNSY
jgi:uncharacterized OsmC-like protein